MTLEEIEDEWDKDAVIDDSRLDYASLEIPRLHHKYYKMYLGEKRPLLKAEAKLARLTGDLIAWYEGSITDERLEELGWEPNPITIKVKSMVSTLVEKDHRYIDVSLAISFQREKVIYLENIVKSLNYRSNIIKNAIDFRKFVENR